MDCLHIVKTGPTPITTGAVSARVAIGNDQGGNPPNYIRIAATAAAYVKLGDSTVTAAAGDMLIQPGDAQIVRAAGFTNVAAIQVAAAGIVQISPLENV